MECRPGSQYVIETKKKDVTGPDLGLFYPWRRCVLSSLLSPLQVLSPSESQRYCESRVVRESPGHYYAQALFYNSDTLQSPRLPHADNIHKLLVKIFFSVKKK